jgi:RHS repeat-associated protein
VRTTRAPTHSLEPDANRRRKFASGGPPQPFPPQAPVAGNTTGYSAVIASYNNAGRLKTLTNGSAAETSAYNALGQRIQISGGTAGTVLYAYDEAGHLWFSDPFGTNAANSNPTGAGAFAYNLKFPGQIFDGQAGLHQNGFRDYDPTIGRYPTSDPVGLRGGVKYVCIRRG